MLVIKQVSSFPHVVVMVTNGERTDVNKTSDATTALRERFFRSGAAATFPVQRSFVWLTEHSADRLTGFHF